MSGLKLKELEIKLEELEKISAPSPALEQYATPARVVAAIVFDAAMRGDVEGKRVGDFGCGSGIFAIASVFMGASAVQGYDIDSGSVELARRNAADILSEEAMSRVTFQALDVRDISGSFDTVFQNPPFGAQRRNADIPFIKKAVQSAGAVYTIHHIAAADYLRSRIRELGGTIEFEKKFIYEMPRMFAFHTKERRKFELILFKVVKIHNQKE